MKPDRVDTFLENVHNLPDGERIALKRSLGKTLSQAPSNAKLAFYRALPDAKPCEELPYFICACGLCAMERLEGKKSSFVSNLKQLAVNSPGGIHSKFAALLDTSMSAEGLFTAKVSRLLRYMKSQGLNVNYRSLLSDLSYWSLDTGEVQKRWSKQYFMPEKEATQNAD